MTDTEQRLLKALKDLVEWYHLAEAPVSLALQRIYNAEMLIKEVENERA